MVQHKEYSQYYCNNCTVIDNYTYCAEHFITYNVESLCCTFEINVLLGQLYFNKKISFN